MQNHKEEKKVGGCRGSSCVKDPNPPFRMKGRPVSLQFLEGSTAPARYQLSRLAGRRLPTPETGRVLLIPPIQKFIDRFLILRNTSSGKHKRT